MSERDIYIEAPFRGVPQAAPESRERDSLDKVLRSERGLLERVALAECLAGIPLESRTLPIRSAIEVDAERAASSETARDTLAMAPRETLSGSQGPRGSVVESRRVGLAPGESESLARRAAAATIARREARLAYDAWLDGGRQFRAAWCNGAPSPWSGVTHGNRPEHGQPLDSLGPVSGRDRMPSGEAALDTVRDARVAESKVAISQANPRNTRKGQKRAAMRQKESDAYRARKARRAKLAELQAK